MATAVGGLVSAAAVATGARVRRSAGAEAERAAGRAQLAQAAGVLAAELAGAAAADSATGDAGDFVEVSDTAVDVRAHVGGGVVCAAGGGPNELVVAGEAAAVGWWESPPRGGDGALVHDGGPLPGAADDRWVARPVADASAAGACATGPFTGATSWRLTLGGAPLPATVGAGAPVRVLRRRRYTLYRGGDGLWWLGQREPDWGGSSVQPLAGPFDAPGASGMRVSVYDSAGALRPAGAPVPAGGVIEVRLRASRRWADRAWRDSARVTVRVRGVGGGV